MMKLQMALAAWGEVHWIDFRSKHRDGNVFIDALDGGAKESIHALGRVLLLRTVTNHKAKRHESMGINMVVSHGEEESGVLSRHSQRQRRWW
jgi:hypothetical protein